MLHTDLPPPPVFHLNISAPLDDLDVPDLRPTTSSTAADADDSHGDWTAFLNMPPTPPGANVISDAGVANNMTSTPDDIFSFNWNLPSSSTKLQTKMPGGAIGSTNSSPVDFAFEAPATTDTKNPYHFTPTGQYPPPYGGYSAGSSFSSSASGSVGGASFSSVDALPAISRDFVRPTGETRRPVTAGGALQGRSPLTNAFTQRKDTIEEEMFTNPFSSADTRTRHTEGVDPRYVPQQSRRASEGVHMPPPAWPQQEQQAAPQQQYQYYSTPFRSSQLVSRPQTSDGLPSFGGPQALPSARSVVGSVDGFTPLSGLAPAAHIRSSYDEAMYRDRPMSSSAVDPRADLQFVPIGGPAPKKRPRRRYDEIERLYLCGWNGCEKSYGTLNHLNAHVAMQKHGEKRLPSEFKDMRKAWRKRKREQAAAAANGVGGSQYGSWGRSSMSSGSEYERRDSTMTGYSADSRYPGDGSVYSYDSRPNTASSVASSIDPRPFAAAPAAPSAVPNAAYAYPGYAAPQQVQQQQQQQQTMGAPHPHQYAARRDSAPQHIPLPSQLGFRVGDDGPTPTQQNPFLIANNSAAPRPAQGAGGYPFQALTQPMPMGAPQYQQFAFQR